MCGREPCSKPNCTWSEAHRLEGEARAVAAMSAEARTEYHALVVKKRGEGAGQELIRAVRELWKHKPGAK